MLEKNQFRNQFGNVMYAQHIHKYIHKRDRLMKNFIWMDECIPLGRVSDPDLVGSDAFAWIRIRIRCFCLDSDPMFLPGFGSGSGFKNSLDPDPVFKYNTAK